MLMSSSSAYHHDHEDWMEQLYGQPPDTPPTSAEFADSTVVTTTTTSSPKSPLSKPIKRRSRALKKTPTTVLNASANNFRALVQQLTGCPKPSSAAFPFGAHRGPVNLNFSNYREEDYQASVQYSNNNNNNCGGHHGLASGSSLYGRPDQTQPQVQLPQNYYNQGSGGMSSSFNKSYTTIHNNGDFVSGSGESAAAQDQEFQFPMEDLPKLTSVSEGFSSYYGRDEW